MRRHLPSVPISPHRLAKSTCLMEPEAHRVSHTPNCCRHPTYAETHSPDYPPITAEDLVKLGVESRLIPFIVSTTPWAEQSQSPNSSPPLSPAEAEDLAETLDKVRDLRP